MRNALLALALVACSSRHDTSRVEVRSTSDCGSVACHHQDYVTTTDPPHAGNFPETCGDCHTTVAWRPALSGTHPQAAFPLQGSAHQGIACIACHDLASTAPSAGGANTMCTACHTQAGADGQHVGVPDYAFDATRPSFCLGCHAKGEAVNHEEIFPIRSGHHRGIACLDCHNASLGPPATNSDCVGCHEHTRTRVDGQHREVGRYVFDVANPHFCLDCHPRGGGGG